MMIWAWIPFLVYSLFAVPYSVIQLKKMTVIWLRSRNRTYTIEPPISSFILLFLFMLLVGLIWFAALTGRL